MIFSIDEWVKPPREAMSSPHIPSKLTFSRLFLYIMMLRRSRNPFLQWLSLFIIASFFCNPSNGDLGTAAHYAPPYLPNACYGNDASQIPTNYYFASAGEGVWDNGAACGRQYKVRCISAANPKICVPGQIILVKIVDSALSSSSRPSADGATMVLSTTAFQAISKSSASSVIIEFQQYILTLPDGNNSNKAHALPTNSRGSKCISTSFMHKNNTKYMPFISMHTPTYRADSIALKKIGKHTLAATLNFRKDLLD
ncbi:RlpA-like protein, double-psi beta-barrel domain [Dillenia turbinata]|uniref:RlpA-like protein, double-psi beta-barrel domain n=1 Tax=Dillenia turbinata TaxID=194707 RepID=A0AAN8UM35_9MAGN